MTHPGWSAAIRTLLFVPADDPHKVERACTSGADAVILDLEDSVAPARKRSARGALGAMLEAVPPEMHALTRINPLASPHGKRDLEALGGLPVAAIVVPKVNLRALELANHAARPLIALVETAAGILDAREIATARDVAALMLGPIDLGAELGIDPSAGTDTLLAARSALVLASAAAGLPAPIDGPCLNVEDPDIVMAEATYAAQIGFGGKACIHPRQVEWARSAFTPSSEQVLWATQIVERWEQAAQRQAGVVSLNGQMIDAPVARRAYTILERSGVVE